MKHLQPYTKFLNEAETLPAGVRKLGWSDYYKIAKPGENIPLPREEWEALETMLQITGTVRRTSTNPNNEFDLSKGETEFSCIPPAAFFGLSKSGMYHIRINDELDEGRFGDYKYYVSPTLDPLMKIVADMYMNSPGFSPRIEWIQIK